MRLLARVARFGATPFLTAILAAAIAACGAGSVSPGAGRGPGSAGATPAPVSARPIASAAPASPSPGSAAPVQPAGATERARLVRVVDGDTIVALVGGSRERVRYVGIDAPEAPRSGDVGEPLASEAAAANRALLADGRLYLERDVSDRDENGRLLRHVWIHRPEGEAWTHVGLELVRTGLARVRDYPPDLGHQDLLEASEEEARVSGVGLWAQDPGP